MIDNSQVKPLTIAILSAVNDYSKTNGYIAPSGGVGIDADLAIVALLECTGFFLASITEDDQRLARIRAVTGYVLEAVHRRRALGAHVHSETIEGTPERVQ